MSQPPDPPAHDNTDAVLRRILIACLVVAVAFFVIGALVATLAAQQ